MSEYILETLSLFVLGAIELWGYWGVFSLMALESANIPIPSEIIMPFSGFLVSAGVFDFWPVVLVGALGNLAGSLGSYYLAERLKGWVIGNRHYASIQSWVSKYGVASTFWGRLLPIVRTFISFPAGLFKVPVIPFSIFTFAGSFIWSALLAYVGLYLGDNWEVIEPIFRKFDLVIAVLLVGGIVWGLKMHFGKKK
ncbi:MAG: DedA family protein [bacterium]|nr:DedA family protein [bacterium]MDZ4231226.1 DedA family protein [Patescibacteria group bacterium]